MNIFHLIRRTARGLLAALLLLAGADAAQAQVWQRALSNLTQPGTSGSCDATATATDNDGNVFVAGSFTGTVRFGATQLVSVNQFSDMFVAKWSAATQSWAWAASGGGGYFDSASGVVVRGHEVFVAGQFISNTNTPITAVIAGVSLPGAGDQDMFLAQYLDQGNTYANGWAVSGGGTGSDNATGGLTLQGSSLYVSGVYDRTGNAQFAGAMPSMLSPAYGGAYLAKYPVAGPGPPGTGWVVDVGTGFAYIIPRQAAVNGNKVFLVGDVLAFAGSVTIAGTVIQPTAKQTTFLAKFIDNGTSVQNGWGLLDDGGVNTVAVRGNVLYTAGGYNKAGSSIAGTVLTPVGGYDAFVARYLDQGTSASGAGAIGEGGPGDDAIYGLALGSNSVFVTGEFAEGAITVSGTSLTAVGGGAVFVAKYADNGSGLGPGWALASGGAPGFYYGGRAIALSGQRVFVVGTAIGAISFGPLTLNPVSNLDRFGFLAVAYDGPAVLPVSLTAFTATAAASSPAAVRLAWTTASETNSARFEVERGADGVSFAKIGTVAAAGNSSTPRQYAWLDAAPPAGATGLYYRLRLVDQDGTATYSPVRAVRLGETPAGLLIFPNPAAGPATLSGATPGIPVQVLDALGRVVLTATADASGVAVLPVPGRPGVYVVRAGEQASRWVVE